MNTILIALMAFLCGGAGVDESARQARSDLAALHQAVAQRIPSGWTAEILPTSPALLISHDQPTTVEYRSVGSFQVIKRVKEPITIRLVAVPFVSAVAYEREKKQNQERRQKRLAFEDQNLSNLFDHVRRSNKIERPYPPSAYDPQTDEEKRIITKYAFVWLNTQPRKLPSHQFENISFRLHALERGASIIDKEKANQYADVLKALGMIITPYE